jgi:hypothetical protein
MDERLTAQAALPQSLALSSPALSPAQVAFLVSLVSGPRPAADCQDAITVGSLMRLNLVAWDEIRHRRRGRKSTFSLTSAAVTMLNNRDNGIV